MSIFNSVLQKTSSLKNVCILFVASHVVIISMLIFTFPIIHNQIGMKVFDMQTFGYSVSMAESIVNNLDAPTTKLYLFPQLTFLDVLYPFLLALFLSSFILRLLTITKSNNKLKNVLLIIPFLAMGFDYLENACIILMISKSIKVTESLALTSSSFTVLKGLLTSLAWLTILIYTLKWFLLRTKAKKIKHPPETSKLD